MPNTNASDSYSLCRSVNVQEAFVFCMVSSLFPFYHGRSSSFPLVYLFYGLEGIHINTNVLHKCVFVSTRCKVRLQSVILEGTFAKIYNGTVLERDGSEKKVIVKTVNGKLYVIWIAMS